MQSTEKLPKLTIGMPVYNGERYIREAIESILAQSFTDFELIISDNASTDNTETICREYVNKDSRIRYLRHPKNIGILENFMYVKTLAQTDYFMWAASDDIWDSDWADRLIAKIISSNNGAAFGQIKVIDSESTRKDHLAEKRTFCFDGCRLRRRLKFFLEPEILGKANLIYSVFRRESLKYLDLRSHKYDYSMIYKILDNSSIASCSNVYLYKRDHKSSTSNSWVNDAFHYKLIRQLFPLAMELIIEYLHYSSLTERFLILLMLPYKILLIYFTRLRLALM